MTNLNTAQREAVLHTEGPLLIFAGAGSGKTRVLTHRIAHLLENGINPRNILAITFTNKAAREMRERVEKITPLGKNVWVSTFHAACTRILRYEIEALGFGTGFSIYDTADSERLLKDCISELNLSETHYSAKYVHGVISSQKNELISPEEYETYAAGNFRESNVADCYALYQKKLRAANALDFDDIIMKLVEIFKANEDILQKWQSRFHYVMVDEYQDTNRAQYVLVNLLAGHARNLCAVGDDDQSIYGWRGADIRNILDFTKDYPEAKTIKLEQNYRSTKTILEAANAVIVKNQSRAEKKLWTDNTAGEKIKVYNASDDRDEAAFAARIVGLSASGGAKYGDFAFLYRTNAQSRVLEEQLVYAGIPYRIFSGVKFYERMEIKDLLAYLKVINNPADDIAAMRVINVPRRGIGATSVSRIAAHALNTGTTFMAAVRDAKNIPQLGKKSAEVLKFGSMLDGFSEFAKENLVPDLMVKILMDTDFTKTFMDGTPEGEERVQNIKELIAKAQVFTEDSEDTSLAKFLEEVALVADIDAYEEEADAVSLMTLHSAKGLEFDTVFLAGFEEQIFPTSRSTESMNPEDMEEERRLCYVGFTRAKKQLYLLHSYVRRRFDKMVANPPSRFLAEVPDDLKVYVNMDGKPKQTRQSSARQKNAARDVPSKAKNSTLPTSPSIAGKGQHEKQNTEAAISQYGSKTAPERPAPKKGLPELKIGERVMQSKFGLGTVARIDPAGADYEITIDFDEKGRKKFMSSLAKFTKVHD